VRTISEGLRQEAGANLRVTVISPGFVHTDFADSMTVAEVKAQTIAARDKMAIPPAAIARAIAFAIEQPADVDVGEITIRPTDQGCYRRAPERDVIANCHISPADRWWNSNLAHQGDN
ncbi:MAG: hypothetical protein H7251_19900, partial [Acetobacteraceae bacterium]|nr:hypothetical protein [Acetobacteraceae bacterium]